MRLFHDIEQSATKACRSKARLLPTAACLQWLLRIQHQIPACQTWPGFEYEGPCLCGRTTPRRRAELFAGVGMAGEGGAWRISQNDLPILVKGGGGRCGPDDDAGFLDTLG